MDSTSSSSILSFTDNMVNLIHYHNNCKNTCLKLTNVPPENIENISICINIKDGREIRFKLDNPRDTEFNACIMRYFISHLNNQVSISNIDLASVFGVLSRDLRVYLE